MKNSIKKACMRSESKRWPIELIEVTRGEWPELVGELPIEVWRSRAYLVQVYPAPGATRISVCRTALGGRGRWRDDISWDTLQRLKRECGRGELFAVEVYPADEDIVNVANMRHLWVLDDPPPFAWMVR